MAKKKRAARAAGSQYDVQKLASATEQTGLIPAAPTDEAAAEAYEGLWPLAGQKTTES